MENITGDTKSAVSKLMKRKSDTRNKIMKFLCRTN